MKPINERKLYRKSLQCLCKLLFGIGSSTKIIFATLLFMNSTHPMYGTDTERKVDICIYGATPAGIMAACTAKSEGKTALLIEPGKRIGGMTAGGLGWTDLYHPDAVLHGYARTFYQRIAAYYGESGVKTTFEPKVALAVFQSFLNDAGIEDVLMHHRIVEAAKQNNRLTSIVVENTENTSVRLRVSARIFLDCSYEGDLMAHAGISYTVGRESNAQYGETHNGVQILNKHQFPDGIDPYREKGNPESGLLWGISSESVGKTGEGNSHVQAYNFRLTLTRDAGNRIPITEMKPDNYDPSRYELLIRYKEVVPWKSWQDCLKWSLMPNNKCDMNNQGPFSTDMIGASWNYPEAGYAERERIYKEHLDYTLGLLYFMWTDSRIPENIRTELARWGFPKDEFEDNNHITPQLYVRESRRMLGECVMTQAHCTNEQIVEDTIAIADYTMDSHNCGRYVVNGMVKNEGDVQLYIQKPYAVSYRAITPKQNEACNVLVPVCLSASHIAFGSIRMEPVYMVLGETAALAACQAIDTYNDCVQQVNAHAVMRKFRQRSAQTWNTERCTTKRKYLRFERHANEPQRKRYKSGKKAKKWM